MENQKFIIAIDGPAGSGKSTTARLVANSISAIYIDTGAMYRVVTLAALRKGICNNPDEIIAVLDKITIRLEPSEDGQRTFLNEEDVSKDIRSAEVTAAVSFVSSLPEVRRRLVAMQREFARQKSVVMDGRDIGTVVFPGADLKIYMTASIGDRAVRRAAEIEASGQKVDVDDIIRALEERDRLDQSRRESPLRKAEDAVEINTSGLSIAEQAQKIITLLEEKNLRS
ncbi:(d)CMP kinase [Ignavibacteria bacterium]|nr:(d)CMP kinase [Bacteroidota bacterium]MCZ2133273.1 (d)CMP kinase [Bacteroidota bacterium]